MDRYTHVYNGQMPDLCVCDQVLRILPNGRWAIIFMTGGVGEPRIENYIAITYSDDQGKTWTPPQTVLKYPDKACLLTEAYIHQNEVRVFIQTHGGRFQNWLVHELISTDNCQTWNEPQLFQPMPQRAFIRNLYVTSWNEWLLPFQSYNQEPFDPELTLDNPWFKQATTGTLISSDQGKTWICSKHTGPIPDFPENNVVQLSDQTLVMLMRASHKDKGITKSISTDRGRTWSPPEQTNIPNPGTKFRLFKHTDGRIALLHNPNPNFGFHHRNPLSLWVSDDDMKSWKYKRIITDFPGNLQYPDGFLDEKTDTIHFAFDYNRKDLIYWAAKLPE